MTDWRDTRPWLADAVVVDGLLPWTTTFLPPGADLATQLRRFHDSGFDHISLTLAAGVDSAAGALARYGHIRRQIDAQDWIVLAHDADAIRAAKAAGHLAISFHFQAGTPFADDLDLVDAFKAVGVGRAIIAYNQANVFGDGCHEPRNAGLTARGHALVQRMDAAGMIVDISHCGERTALDTIAAGLSHPPILSHSNARALFDHERNVSDDLIRACAEAGGYIGVNGVGFFLGAEGDEVPTAMARHAAHIANIAGADRVGLGLDFMYLAGSDYGFFHAARGRWPRGYPDPPWSFLQPEQLGDLVGALEAVGFANDEVRGILGETYLRLVAGPAA